MGKRLSYTVILFRQLWNSSRTHEFMCACTNIIFWTGMSLRICWNEKPYIKFTCIVLYHLANTSIFHLLNNLFDTTHIHQWLSGSWSSRPWIADWKCFLTKTFWMIINTHGYFILKIIITTIFIVYIKWYILLMAMDCWLKINFHKDLSTENLNRKLHHHENKCWKKIYILSCVNTNQVGLC